MKKLMIVFAACCVFNIGLAHGAPVRIAYLQNDIHHLPFWVAMEKGFFGGEEVTVEVAGVFKAGPELMSGFASGDLDMGYVGVAPATTAAANKTARVVALAQVNTEGSAIVVKKDGKMQRLSDLVNKIMAVPGHATVQDALFRRGLLKSNVPADQVKILILKPPEMIGSLRTDQIDAFIAWEPYPAQAVTMGVGRVLASSSDLWKDHPCCILAADVRFLEKSPGQARAVVRAHVKAVDFIERHRDEAVKIGVKYTGMNEETVRLAMGNVKYTSVLSIEGEKEYVDFLTRLKYIKVDQVQTFVDQFMRPDFVKESIKK